MADDGSATRRAAISKTVRFEILKRDNFTCRYCGAQAPAARLEVDHRIPVAAGGRGDFTNLVTACADCNGGKGARLLTDAPVLAYAVPPRRTVPERRGPYNVDRMMLDVHGFALDTGHLTTEQVGAYGLLLMAAWRRGGRLPEDDRQLAALAHMTPAKWRDCKALVMEPIAGGRLPDHIRAWSTSGDAR